VKGLFFIDPIYKLLYNNQIQTIFKYGKCLTDVKEKTLMRTKYFYNISYKVENAI